MGGNVASSRARERIAVLDILQIRRAKDIYLADGLGIGFLMAVRFIHGLSFGVTNTVLPALAVNALPATRLGEGIASFIDASTFTFSVFMFLVAFSYSSINAFINSYVIDLGMGVYASFVFLVYSVMLLITRLFTGRLQDRYGENCVLYSSNGLMSSMSR